MALTNFRASDFNKSGPKTVASKRDKNVKAPQHGVPTSKPIISEGADPEAVPEGTVPEILTWVGEDPVRAQKALDSEVDSNKPRKGLVSSLYEIIEAEDE